MGSVKEFEFRGALHLVLNDTTRHELSPVY